MQTETIYNNSITLNEINNTHLSQLNENESKLYKAIKIILLITAFAIPISTSIVSFSLSIFLFLWIIEGNFVEKTKHIWKYSAFFAPIIIFISLLVGSIYSTAELGVILVYLKKMSKLIYLPLLVFYFKDFKQRSYCINALIISGIIVSISGIIRCNFYNQGYLPDKNSLLGFKNTIDLSLLTIVTVFLLLHKINLSNKIWNNLLIVLCLLLSIFHLFYICIGRTGQLVFLLLMVLFVIQKLKSNSFMSKKKPIMLCALLVLIAGFMFSSTTFYRLWSITLTEYITYRSNTDNYQENSISLRLIYYKNTLALIAKKPLSGWGTGSFAKAYKELVISKNKFIDPKYIYTFPNNPHNEYLLFGAQLGIVGIALLIWFFYVLLKTSITLIKYEYEKFILQGIIVTMIIGCLANSWLMDFTSGNLFVFLTAISLGSLLNVHFKRNN